MPKKAQTTKKSTRTSNKLHRKLAKKEGLIIPPLTLIEITPDKVKSTLEQLLQDDGLVDLMKERAGLGCSPGSIAATLRIPSNRFNEWVQVGKHECSKYDPEFTLTPEMRLWQILSEGWAQARTLAEAQIASNNPEKFLKSRTSKLLGDDWEEDTNTSQSEEDTSSMKLDMATNLLDTLKEFRKQGFDLNEIIDTDQLSLRIDPPKPKTSSILEANGLAPSKKCSVPPSLQNVIDAIPVPIDKDKV